MDTGELDAEKTGPIPVIPAAGPAPASGWRRRLSALGLAVLLLASVMALGIWVGWRMAVDRDITAPDAVAAVEDKPAAGEENRMPDVRGLKVADAKQAIADTGLDPAVITVVEVPAALEPGTVVGQDPVGGDAATGKAQLRIAKQAIVPGGAGRPEQDVVNELAAFGTRVHVQQRYAPQAQPGTVLETAPAAGQPVGPETTVVVAAQPASVFLDEISLLEGSCGKEKLKINAAPFEHGLNCRVGSDTTIEVLLDRGVAKVSGTVGIPDDGKPADAVRLVISGDGRELYRHDLRYGAGQRVELATAGILRLTVSVATLDEDQSPSLAMGDMVLFGAPDTIAQLDR